MSTRKTDLLVSVRSAPEAATALAGGANVIDVKEPDHGALGAADPQVWRDVLQAVAGRAPVSAALGELFGDDQAEERPRSLAPKMAGLAFAKIGLAGAAQVADWRRRWQESLLALPRSVTAVAVAYADWQTAQAPPPETVIDCGAELGCSLVLFDTFSKSRGHLLDHLPPAALSALMRRAEQRSLQVVLAGSLTQRLLPRVLALSPALVAVRGAACRGDRASAIDEQRVRELADALAADASTNSAGTIALRAGA